MKTSSSKIRANRTVEVARSSATRASLFGLVALVSGCSLGNLTVDACQDDSGCVAAFGVGSVCGDGYCSEPARCETGHQCRVYGGGACVEGVCRAELPPDPLGACVVGEPANLAGQSISGEGTPIVIGAMFLPGSDFSPPILDAATLAIREINSVGGVGEGRPLGMVVCDNGGAMNGLTGDERKARIDGVVDYLAGTLGAPFVIGPLTSGDSLFAVSRALAKGYPTAFVSPSATSPALTLQPDRLNPDDPYGLFWRSAPSDQLQGAVLATSVAGEYPQAAAIDHVAIAFRDDAYGQGLADAFQKSFSGKTSLVKFASGAELGPVVANLASLAPDALMFVDIGGDRAVEFIGQMADEASLASLPLYLADGSKNEALLDAALTDPIRTIVFEQTVGTVAAAPEGTDFNLFQSSYAAEFGGADPANSAFTANGYDAGYLGAAGVAYALFSRRAFDGRDVAAGLAKLAPPGPKVRVGKLDWGALKSGLTTGSQQVDIVGVSGDLDFDVTTGEAPAPIEVWQPSMKSFECGGKPPCFRRLTVVNP